MLISVFSHMHENAKNVTTRFRLSNDRTLNSARLLAVFESQPLSGQSICTIVCGADGLDGLAAVC